MVLEVRSAAPKFCIEIILKRDFEKTLKLFVFKIVLDNLQEHIKIENICLGFKSRKNLNMCYFKPQKVSVRSRSGKLVKYNKMAIFNVS